MTMEEDLKHALCLMKTALELVDRCEHAGDAGAHLDLAIHRLEGALPVNLRSVPPEVPVSVSEPTKR
jgi:hypothetical protein